MQNEKGSLSINSENIMPIIKKWLYSDSDIFVRELVSNAADAITKHSRLVSLGEAPSIGDEKYRIELRLNKEEKTITVADNGLGMTAEEVKKYINQIAFSGASDFMARYKSGPNSEANDIIGHFGLGFYSAFMVALTVEIDTLSFVEGAKAVHWMSDGSTEFEISSSRKTERGTEVKLHVNDESGSFLDEFKLREILKKYCGFLPVEIYFVDENKKEDSAEESEACECEHDHEHGEDCDCKHEHTRKESPINNTSPLWVKKPSDCTDEEYKAFYRDTFLDFNEPLFWIHLNMDYPFRLKGILYFPKLKHELESIEGQVKLFNNQVFIAENIKEVIPDFLLLLKGCIDCPDLPLNVSRSFLQNDSYVTQMSKYITKKVADKLNSVFSENREQYNKFWDDINQFIKYGCIRDKDFYEKVKGSLVYKTVAGEYLTGAEYLDKNKGKADAKIFYITNEQQQAQYIKLFRDEDIETVLMTTKLDAPFMSYVEGYERNFKFARIDADLSEALKQDEDVTDKKELEVLTEVFKSALSNDKLKYKTEALKNSSVAAVILLSEQSRRMKEMSAMFGSMPGMPAYEDEETLVLNTNNSLIKRVLEMREDESRKEDLNLACEHIYDLAMLTHKPLSVDEMTAFIERSNKLLERII